jgi:hypothetical protein
MDYRLMRMMRVGYNPFDHSDSEDDFDDFLDGVFPDDVGSDDYHGGDLYEDGFFDVDDIYEEEDDDDLNGESDEEAEMEAHNIFISLEDSYVIQRLCFHKDDTGKFR